MESKLTLLEIEEIRQLAEDGDMNMLKATMDVVDQLLDNSEKVLKIQEYLEDGRDEDKGLEEFYNFIRGVIYS